MLTHDTQYWATATPEVRQEFIKDVSENYEALLTELAEHANVCVGNFQEFTKRHTKWRQSLIMLTGVLAILNVVIAWISAGKVSWLSSSLSVISLGAAAYAAVLAVLQNLESFHQYPQRALLYRETREIFLDAVRDFHMRWEIHVRALFDTPPACINAEILYQELTSRDREIRLSVKEAMQAETRTKSR